jgi:diguanylate cyclase (GGDEF)-like protein
MTTLYNRNAFNNDVAQLSINTEYSIISLDLNNLKSVNDNLGHQAGDRYIINAANIINDIFGHEGTCYRIGGDEFSVIIQKPDSGMVTEKLIKKLEKEIEIHNTNNPSEPVYIAYGYHSHTPDSAYDYNETLHLADEKMYENKRLQKGSL